MFLEVWPKDNLYSNLLRALFKIQSSAHLSRVKESDSLQVGGDMEFACQLILVILMHAKASHSLGTSMDPG